MKEEEGKTARGEGTQTETNTDTEQTLTKIKNYFNKNGLPLNSMKTQCIFIGSRALIYIYKKKLETQLSVLGRPLSIPVGVLILRTAL